MQHPTCTRMDNDTLWQVFRGFSDRYVATCNIIGLLLYLYHGDMQYRRRHATSSAYITYLVALA